MSGAQAVDLEAVRTFLLLAELRSFTRAAEAMGATQSAVSLRLKRLEAGLGRRLLERTPRLVRLSADGQSFLAPARALVAAHETAASVFERPAHRLVVGLSQHVVGAELPAILRRLGSSDPSLVLELRIDTSRAILDAYDAGTLDAAIVLRHGAQRRGGERLLREAFGWMAARDFVHRAGEPLRLAGQDAPCGVRTIAIEALDAAGIAWTEVFVGGGVTTIGAAVSAGLAVAALARRVAPRDAVDVGTRLGLPPLPPLDLMLHANVSDPRARSSIRLLAAALKASAPEGG
jgi:DNA-binding transcriptional LysR family regulator